MCPLVYFKDYKKCSPFPLHCSWCSIHKSILTECVRWYISETIIVSLLPGTIHDIDYNRYTDRMCSLVYSKDCRNYSPSLSHYSWCSLHTGISTEYVYWYIPENNFSEIYRQNVFIGIFQRLWELFLFSLTLFMMFITYRYTNRICSLVYSRDYENCSLLNVLIINVLLTVDFFSNRITDEMKSHW